MLNWHHVELASIWLQVAGDANIAGQVYPDQSLYPCNSVPALVERINNALQRADQIEHAEGNVKVRTIPPVEIFLTKVTSAWWCNRMVCVPGGLGFEPQRLRGFLGIARGLSRHSPMSEVCAPRHLAGLVSTHG